MNISSMPAWVTIDEAVEIINQNKLIDKKVKAGDIYRFALYGHLTLSIYFQSPVKLRKVVFNEADVQYDEVNGDIIERLCHLCHHCFQNNDNLILKTEENSITPPGYILDASLQGQEYSKLQTLLANSLDLPPPVTGLHNIHHGVLVNDNGIIYQVFESCSWKERISRQIKKFPAETAVIIHEKIKNSNALRNEIGFFTVYQFPDDACFVVKRNILEHFIETHFSTPATQETAQTRISTPVSRLLWLACKHNDSISPLIKHPYKLLSVFEQWAVSEGIYTPLSGETLKTALERGSPGSSTPSA
ncbi:TPA: hypothetical protein H2W70_004140 [Salmonella enterica]|nr:hypothetical protein [Salmonella enterica]HAK8195241.1 hypothetical protein [Salmonella enterica]HAK8434589.1 hypothetical protein [Salmonella enterica]HAK8462337.1 hypothetical protein [Salmonella enterica]